MNTTEGYADVRGFQDAEKKAKGRRAIVIVLGILIAVVGVSVGLIYRHQSANDEAKPPQVTNQELSRLQVQWQNYLDKKTYLQRRGGTEFDNLPELREGIVGFVRVGRIVKL